jgi:opacity protein-like surface antigen
MIRKVSSYMIIMLFAVTTAKAQEFYSTTEYGVGVGGAQYFGDLNETTFKYIRPTTGIFIRYHFNPFISARVNFNYAHVGFDDKLSDNPYNRKRNLNFQSEILEASVQAEFNFFRFATGAEGSRWTPYLTGGVGVFRFNPYTYYNDQKVYLQTVGTEGQNHGYDQHKYTRTSWCFPVGAGIKYWLRPGVNVGIEIADRLTLTDYMDDVSTYYVDRNMFAGNVNNPVPAYYIQDRSLEVTPNEPLGRPGKQRGNPATRDQYLTGILTISFQLKVYKCPGYLNKDFMQGN